MRTIKDIGLQLDYEETKHMLRMYASDFAFRSRFIGNYLKRSIKQIKFEPTGYNRIIINGCYTLVKPNRLFESALNVSIPFNKDYYDSLTDEAAIDYFIELYKNGVLKAAETHDVPVDFFLEQLQLFKRNNYKNEWEFKSKLFKEIGIKAILFCKMTMESFSLFLILSKEDEVVFKKEILNTLPDEIIFHYRFKDIIFKNNEIIVIDRFEKPLYKLDLTFKI